MELKHAKLSDNPTVQEINEVIELLEAQSILHSNMDEGLKRLINSTFGVLGYIKFPCYHLETALAVTQQAADLLKYAQNMLNDYFSKDWPTDHELHKKLGITQARAPLDEKGQPYNAVVYMDTDSTFIRMGRILKNCDYKGDELDFVLTIHKERLDGYIKKKLFDYCGPFGAFTHKTMIDGTDTFEGSPTFALAFEQIAESIVWVAKKRYIKHLRWYKKARYDRMKKVDIRGLETRSSATPTYVRTELKRLFLYITDKGTSLNREKLTDELRKIKKQFDLLPTDSICKMARLGTYDKNKINDTTGVEYVKGADPEITGAILYNYLLNQNPELKSRYPMIQQGMRVKWYYIKRPFGEVESFSYLPDTYPAEFAPEMAINTQFEKLILQPVNNVVTALKLKPIIRTLLTPPELF